MRAASLTPSGMGIHVCSISRTLRAPAGADEAPREKAGTAAPAAAASSAAFNPKISSRRLHSRLSSRRLRSRLSLCLSCTAFSPGRGRWLLLTGYWLCPHFQAERIIGRLTQNSCRQPLRQNLHPQVRCRLRLDLGREIGKAEGGPDRVAEGRRVEPGNRLPADENRLSAHRVGIGGFDRQQGQPPAQRLTLLAIESSDPDPVGG